MISSAGGLAAVAGGRRDGCAGEGLRRRLRYPGGEAEGGRKARLRGQDGRLHCRQGGGGAQRGLDVPICLLSVRLSWGRSEVGVVAIGRDAEGGW